MLFPDGKYSLSRKFLLSRAGTADGCPHTLLGEAPPAHSSSLRTQRACPEVLCPFFWPSWDLSMHLHSPTVVFPPKQLCFTPNCRRSKLSYDDNTAQGHESAWLRSHRSTSSLLGRSLDAHGEKSCKTQGRHCSARLLPVCCASMAAHLGVPLKTSRNTRSSTEDYRKDESQKVLAEQHPV